jgi:5'-3' exonuclease
MTRPASIALVDLGYLFKKRWVTHDGSPMGAARASLRDIEKLRHGVEHVIICADAPPYRRKDMYAEYKAHRPAPAPEETVQRKYLRGELIRLGYNTAWSQGYEADDVIATLAWQYAEWCDDVRIVGPDKDMAQCINAHVRQFIPPVGDREWEIRDEAAVERKFKVKPALMPLYQALCGDKDDNVPGVKGIGPVKAAELATKYQTLQALAEGMVTESKFAGGAPSAVIAALATHWEKLVLSLKLVTLDTAVPVDPEALLVKRQAEPAPRSHNNMDVELDGYVGNEVPSEPPASETQAVFDRAKQIYDAQFTSANDQTVAEKDEGLLEKEYQRERDEQEEHDARASVARTPTDVDFSPKPAAVATPAVPAPPAPAAPQRTTALAKTDPNKYGLVNAELQPLDLESAYTLSKWLKAGGLYKQFANEAQIFTVILQGRELGVGATTALANTHMIDGKPVKHADFIRALVEKDPNFEYLMPVEMSPTRCVWEGKHKRQPRPVTYTYTIEDAQTAGLVRLGNYGGKGNWYARPQDMLNKTAASKLARLLWPGATMGLYCPEEMGYSEEELSQQEAA